MLILLCEKRIGLQLIKFIQILDLTTYEKMREDIRLDSQSLPQAIRVCTKDKYLGISHQSGYLEIWLIDTILKRDKPTAYRVFENIASSDFIIYYHDNLPRITTLLSVKSEDFESSKKCDT